MALGVKMAEIFFKKPEKNPFEKTRKRPLESVKIKILKIGLRSDLRWPTLGLQPKFHDPVTFGGFGKRGQTHKQTRFMFYKYRFPDGKSDFQIIDIGTILIKSCFFSIQYLGSISTRSTIEVIQILYASNLQEPSGTVYTKYPLWRKYAHT